MSETKKLAVLIRTIARQKYVLPAIQAHRSAFSIPVRDLMEEVRKQGVSPDRRTPAFCTSIQTRDFLQENGLEIEGVDGPRSKLSTTVVVHYRLADEGNRGGGKGSPSPVGESPLERAFRLTEKIRGLMKDEIAAHGGPEGFMRWVRSDSDENEAA